MSKIATFFLFFFFWSTFVVFCDGVDPGEPLFLSKYLPNQAKLARKLSEVHGVGNFTSYSGYLTVNAQYESNMFFWFFPAQNGDANAPVLLWLQGGPGGPSMFGLFSENGPFSVDADGKTLIPRKWTWNSKYAMLYIDNPVGTGWSFTNNEKGFAENQDDVARDLYSALVQFFQVFPDYKNNDFYVTGESYAGKYIPAITYKIHKENPTAGDKKINLKGLSIGDGAIAPEFMFTDFGNFLYYLGFADEEERLHIQITFDLPIATLIIEEKWDDAFYLFDKFLNGDFFKYGTYFQNITGTTNYFNYLDPVYPPNPYPKFLNLDSTRAAIHTGKLQYSDGNSTVESHLISDWMKSMAYTMPTLLENYKVLVYNGQLDIILGPSLAEGFYRNIPWSGQREFIEAKKIVWKNNSKPAAYVRQVKNFVQVVVREAGHLLPADQPEVAFKMIDTFIQGKPFQ